MQLTLNKAEMTKMDVWHKYCLLHKIEPKSEANITDGSEFKITPTDMAQLGIRFRIDIL